MDKGAITQAIEALQEAYDGNVSPGVDDSVLREALEALKAFKDGVPKGLEKANEETKCFDVLPTDNWAGCQYQAAKHLQDGIK